MLLRSPCGDEIPGPRKRLAESYRDVASPCSPCNSPPEARTGIAKPPPQHWLLWQNSHFEIGLSSGFDSIYWAVFTYVPFIARGEHERGDIDSECSSGHGGDICAGLGGAREFATFLGQFFRR
jgi:hypothetical protein